jgi:hypothetical protein
MGVLEVATGVGLLAFPSLVAVVLLGSSLEGAAASILGRVCGVALISLGIACLLVRDVAGARSSTGLTLAMCVYNAAVAALLTYGFFRLGLRGIALWPAILIHVVLLLCCALRLRTFSAGSA